MDPDEERQAINTRIMETEAETPEVFAVSQRSIQRDSRHTPIRIYTPSKEDDFPLILMIHGGAWIAGNLNTHDHLARYLCRGVDAVVISVGYTNAPEAQFPTQIEQCYDALLFASANKEDLKTNGQLAVVGDSAGGNMAAVLCQMARDRMGPKIDFQVLINPAPDLGKLGTLQAQGDDHDGFRTQVMWYLGDPKYLTHPYASPMRAEDLSNLPPALVLLAEHDELRESGQHYAVRLQEANVHVTVYCQMGAHHLAGGVARAANGALESLEVAKESLKNSFLKPQAFEHH